MRAASRLTGCGVQGVVACLLGKAYFVEQPPAFPTPQLCMKRVGGRRPPRVAHRRPQGGGHRLAQPSVGDGGVSHPRCRPLWVGMAVLAALAACRASRHKHFVCTTGNAATACCCCMAEYECADSNLENPHFEKMTLAGLEPAIPGSVGRCLIHWATGLDACNRPLDGVWCPGVMAYLWEGCLPTPQVRG